MRIRRRLPIVFGVILVGIAVALVVVLRKHAPPEPARLLPSADGFAYLNLKWIRRANVGGELPPVSHDPEYEEFIQQTGFQFERDLDQIAVAIHYPSSLPSGTARLGQSRYSEVFVGKVNGEKLRAYLRKLSSSVDDYRSTEIYNVPFQGRTVRVAMLSVDTVAASNHPDPLVIRGMIDRSRKLASPFGGPAFLRQYYKRIPIANRYVPFSNLGWAIFQCDPAGTGFAEQLSFLFSKPAVVIVSAHYLEGVQLKAEAFTGSDDEARQVTEKLNTFLTLFHSAEISLPGQSSDADVKQFFDSLKVVQNNDRAVLTAKLTPAFIKKAVQGSSGEAIPNGSSDATKPPSATPHKGQVQ